MTRYSGIAPEWLARVPDADFFGAFDPGALSRGNEYAQNGQVTSVRSSNGRTIEATVEGGRPSAYTVIIDPGLLGRESRSGPQITAGPELTRVTLWGACSCPMFQGCKHVAATLIVAREWAARGLTNTPEWKLALNALIPKQAPAGRSPLGLRLAFTQTRYDRVPRAVLLPVRKSHVTSKTRSTPKWVKTGASWRDIEYGYGRDPIDQTHRQAMVELLKFARTAGPGFNAYGDPSMHLDQLGPGVWAVLRRVHEAGVAFIGPSDATAVTLARTDARLEFDVRQVGEGDAVLTALLSRGDDEPLPLGATLFGDPVHGYLLEGLDHIEIGGVSPTVAREVAALAGSSGLTIPAADLAEFQFSYYPQIRDHATVISSDGSVELPEISAPQLKLAVTFAPKHLVTLDWAFTYAVGDRQVEFQLTDSALVGRDTKAENELLAMLDDFGGDALWNPLFHGLARRTSVTLVGMDTSDFARKALPELIADPRIDVVVSGEPADYSEADAPPLISVTTADSEDPDWFELNVAVSIDGETVELAALLLALGSGDEYLLLDSGTSFRLDRPELQSLRDLIEEARGLAETSGGSLRLTRLHVGLWEDLVNLGVVAEQSTRWRDSVRQLLSASALATHDAEAMSEAAPLALPEDFGTELRPYQQAGYEWLCQLWDLRLGGILADDMGLGKTVQTLALASRAAHARQLGANGTPLLIVAPTSVVATWAEQTQRFCPQLRTATINETQSRSGVPLSEAADGMDIVVTSYALFRIDAEAYQQIAWSGLVLDEAQFVKNHQSKTYQAARRLKADFKLAITGTPMENSLMDLWSMLSIAAPGLFPNPKRFTQDYLKPIEQGKDSEVLERLRRRVRPLMLRRTKDQVALDLPPKTEQVLHVPLHARHRRIYDTHLNRERQRLLGMLDDMNRNRIEILKSLTTLRQLSLDAALLDPAHDQNVPSAKIDVLVEQLQEVAAEGHRALVFSQFTRFLGRVRDRLGAEGIETCYLDGRTRDRQRRIDEFVNGTAPAFLISLKAGGFGLNLTAADYVYVLDPWWNPAAEAQAVDRTHRIGQERPVMVYRLISTGTIEEKVMALQDRKRELFAAVMDGGTTGAPLTPDDIRALLSP